MAIKITDSFFVNNGDTTKVQLKYPKPGVIIMQTPRNEYRLNKNGTVERNDGVDWVIPVTEDPDYHKNLILQADKNKKDQPVNIFKYYWNKIFKNEQGGAMNYSLYLQLGGELEQPQIENRLGKKEVQQLVANIINGDEESARILVDNAMKDPENADIREALAGAQEAANQGNEQAVKFMSIVGPLLEQAQQIAAHKCGGKVRAKIKKACGGKKMKKGGETPIKKEAKGGKPCPCTLHKVGGKLIEVDCNGVPIAKNGAVLYAEPGTLLPPALASQAVRSYMTAKPVSSAIAFSDQWFADLGKAFVNKINGWQNKLQQKNPDFWGTPTSTKKEAPAKITVSEPVIGSAEWQALRRAAVEAYNKSPEGQVIITNADAAVAARNQSEQPTWMQRFDSGQVRYGGLTKEEALARQNEMLAAKAQGFNVDLGRWGADGMWGNQSRSEWEKYQAWKKLQEAAAELARRQAPDPSLLRIEPENKYLSPGVQNGLAIMSTPTSTVKVSIPKLNRSFASANIGGIKPDATNLRASDRLDLNTMTAGQALSLNKGDYENWINNFRNRTLYQKKWRNDSL